MIGKIIFDKAKVKSWINRQLKSKNGLMVDIATGIIGNGYVFFKIDIIIDKALKEKGITKTGVHRIYQELRQASRVKMTQAWFKHLELSRDYTSFTDTKHIYIDHKYQAKKTTHYRVLEHLNDYTYIKQDILELFKDSWNLQRFDMRVDTNSKKSISPIIFKYGSDPIAIICTERTDYPRYRPTPTERLD